MRAIILSLRFILSLLLLCLLLLNLGLLASFHLAQENPPQLLGYYLMHVDSPDMAGTLQEHDAVVIQAQPSYSMGEVVAYTRSGKTMLHRIVGYNPSGFITKGDACPDTDDRLLTESDILGLAVLQLPAFGAAAKFLTSPFCTLCIAASWLLLCLLPGRLLRRDS